MADHPIPPGAKAWGAADRSPRSESGPMGPGSQVPGTLSVPKGEGTEVWGVRMYRGRGGRVTRDAVHASQGGHAPSGNCPFR